MSSNNTSTGRVNGTNVNTQSDNSPIDDMTSYLPYIILGGIALATLFFVGYLLVKPVKSQPARQIGPQQRPELYAPTATGYGGYAGGRYVGQLPPPKPPKDVPYYDVVPQTSRPPGIIYSALP